MNFEEEMKELVALQATKITEDFTIVEFAAMALKEKDKFICKEAAEDFFKNLNDKYMEFVVSMAEDIVVKLFNKRAEEMALKKALKELEEADIVKTGRQVALDNIKKQMVLITLFDQDEKLIDNYEMMFGIDLNKMSEEEINEIDLTVFTDCQPW